MNSDAGFFIDLDGKELKLRYSIQTKRAVVRFEGSEKTFDTLHDAFEYVSNNYLKSRAYDDFFYRELKDTVNWILNK